MSAGFERLEVKGYRRLRRIDLSLRPFNVLIGANGVGKSSILEVIDLLAASADGVLEQTISHSGGVSSLITADGKTDSMHLALHMPVTAEQPIVYQMSIASEGNGYSIVREELTQQQDQGSEKPFRFLNANAAIVEYYKAGAKKPDRPNWEYKRMETALSQVPKMYKKPENFRNVLASSAEIYHTLSVSARAPVRLPQSMQPARTPGTDGEDLLSCLYLMRETERDRFEAVEDALRAAFPTFDRIDLPPAAAGSLTLAWRDRSFVRPIFPHQLSEGTLRFLWLVTLLQSPELPAVTLIDEPEVSLHPEMLQLLAELMREASSRTQLVVATHSDRFVRFLDPDELVVCDLDECGGTTVRRASDLDLDAWMKNYSLDQLWSMGRLGGRS
jgi:predicted ATPase